MFRLIDIMIDITFFSINLKNYFDRSILVISMTVLYAAVLSNPAEIFKVLLGFAKINPKSVMM